MITYPIALTIAGSDSGGCAGIQADLKTFSSLGVFGTSVITAITAQNTMGVVDVMPIPSDIVKKQLRAVMDDFEIGAIKVGMLFSKENVFGLYYTYKEYAKNIPLVVDPVMVSTSGNSLIMDETIDAIYLVLLDIMLPGMAIPGAEGQDGLSILKKLRSQPLYRDLPIIMLTAKGSEADKVKGLNFGADDYIAKPFGVTELIARINALLRRTTPSSEDKTILIFKTLSLNTEKHLVMADEKIINLTFLEFELLHYLLLNAELVLSREKLTTEVWGYDFLGESRTVDMHIKSLRKKLGPAGTYIKTIRSVGYKIGE